MPKLSQLTDYQATPEGRIYVSPSIPTSDYGDLYNPTYPDELPVVAQQPSNSNGTKSVAEKIADKLLGLHGEERYQLWPEKVVRSALTAIPDAYSGKIPMYDTDPETGELVPSQAMIGRAMDMATFAGVGGVGGTGEAAGTVLGATPSLRPALKYGDRLYKGKEGQQHMDVIPDHLYNDFQQKAMSGDDISHYNFGFVNDKGHFLDREAALKYGIDSGLIDPQAGKFGALTSTLMADSSKPGLAIESMRFSKNPNPTQLENMLNKSEHGSLRGMVDDSGMHVWDASKAIHSEGAKELGLNYNHENRFHVSKSVEEPGYSILDIGDEWIKNPDKLLANKHLVRFLKNDKVLIDFPGHGKITGPEYLNMLKADSSKPGMAIEATAKTAQPFYSAVEHTVNSIQQPKMTGEAWLGTIAKPGVKPEELDWTGLRDFLTENKGQTLTKQQVQDYVAANKVELKEVNKGSGEYHYLQQKDTLENRLRYFDSILPNFKSQSDIALAKQHNPAFRESVKGYSDQEIFNAIQDAKKPVNFPQTSQRYDTLAEAQAALKEGGLENHFDIKTEPNVGTKYHSYQLPGGENYREMLMTLPNKRQDELYDLIKNNKASTEQMLEYSNLARESNNYKSSHWDEPNILAHVRMNDRTIEGKKSLHLEEIQSDWHQQGRDKGYAQDIPQVMAYYEANGQKIPIGGGKSEAEALASTGEWPKVLKNAGLGEVRFETTYRKGEGVPDAPFKKTWHELALKRMLREAAEKGYDRLSWTPGEAQAARYDLSKHITELTYNPKTNELRAYNTAKNGIAAPVLNEKVTPDKISDFVGKEAAKKLLETPHDETNPYSLHSLTNQDLKIGGEGMKGFYDQIIPKALEKIGKEHGVKVKSGFVNANAEGRLPAGATGRKLPVHYIDIPQSLKDRAMQKGFPLFSSAFPGYIFKPVDGNPFEEKK